VLFAVSQGADQLSIIPAHGIPRKAQKKGGMNGVLFMPGGQ